jgi:hypothetical protein
VNIIKERLVISITQDSMKRLLHAEIENQKREWLAVKSEKENMLNAHALGWHKGAMDALSLIAIKIGININSWIMIQTHSFLETTWIQQRV